MAANKIVETLIIVLAVVGAIALISWALMALLAGGALMSGMMDGDMRNCCGGIGAAILLGGAFLLLIITAAVVWLVRSAR